MCCVKLISFDIWRTLLDLDRFYDMIISELSDLTSKPKEGLHSLFLATYKDALKARLRGEFTRPIIDSARFFSDNLGVDVEVLFISLIRALRNEGVRDLAYPDAKEALKEIKKRGLKIAFLGNVLFWPGMITRLILHENALLSFADYTLFGDELGVQKPSKEVFEYLSEVSGIDLGEIIHIGDHPVNDFAGALMAGVRAALIKRASPSKVIKVSDTAFIISDLRQLIEILESEKE